MIALPSGLLSVLSVGPGVSATYGTDVTAATTRPARTQQPAMISVTSRWDMGSRLGTGGSLRTIDPLAFTACEELVLPDRHCRLHDINQLMASGESDIAVRGCHRSDHCKVANLQVPRAVGDREREHRIAGCDLLGDPAKLRIRCGVSAIGQGGHATSVIMITDRAYEQCNGSGSGICYRVSNLIHRQRFCPQLSHPDNGHHAKLQPPGYAMTIRS